MSNPYLGSAKRKYRIFRRHFQRPNVAKCEEQEGLYVAKDPQAVRKVGPQDAMYIPQYISARLFGLSNRLRQKVKNAGDIADYVSWQMETFGKARCLSSREKLWELMARRLSQQKIHGMRNSESLSVTGRDGGSRDSRERDYGGMVSIGLQGCPERGGFLEKGPLTLAGNRP